MANVIDATTDTVPLTNTVIHVNMTNVSKLTTSNYLMWSLQVHALLDGHALADHLDASAKIPSATIPAGNSVAPNPEFTIWKRQDQLVFSALIGAISTSLQPLVSRATSASEIWGTLASTYAKPSRGHIKQLKTQLKNWCKGTKTIDEYLQGAIMRLDQLAILGKPMDHEDQLELILDGLPEEYKSVVDQIEGKDLSPTITEVHERLLNHEAKLLSTPSAAPSMLPVSANAVQHRNNTHKNHNNQRKFHNNTNWQLQQSSFRPNNHSPRPYLGKCQICNVQGHSARRCPQLQALQPGFNNSQASSFMPWQPRANMAIGSPYNASNWLLDSGATHHITSDLNNLAMHQPYQGGEDVMTADGSNLAITHTGEGSDHGNPVTPRPN